MKTNLLIAVLAVLALTLNAQNIYADAFAGMTSVASYSNPTSKDTTKLFENNGTTDEPLNQQEAGTQDPAQQLLSSFVVNTSGEIEEQLYACTEMTMEGNKPVNLKLVKTEQDRYEDYPETRGTDDGQPRTTNLLYNPSTQRDRMPHTQDDDPTKEGETKTNETPVTTPEPATLILLGCGLTGLIPFARRGRK